MSGNVESHGGGMEEASRYSAEGSLKKLQEEYGYIDEALDSTPLTPKGSLETLREEHGDIDRELQMAWYEGLEEQSRQRRTTHLTRQESGGEGSDEVRAILTEIERRFYIANGVERKEILAELEDILGNGESSVSQIKAIKEFLKKINSGEMEK